MGTPDKIILLFSNMKLIKLIIPSIFTICCLNTPLLGGDDNGNSTTKQISVYSGWNILSLPVYVTDSLKISLFPTAVSHAFISLDGYQVKDTLQFGQGFWLKFDSSETFAITGESIVADTMEVNAGWNMVGSLTVPIAVNTIQSEPFGIIASQFYRYVPGVGYQAADTLQPGLGYWVKVK